MSLLDGILGSLTGGSGGNAGGLMEIAGQLLQRAGGIQGLQNILAGQGLGDQAGSWIGNGANQAVDGDQLGQALQQGGLGDILGQAAQGLGVDSGQLNSQLAQALPALINHLTPDGNVPGNDGPGLDLSDLAGLAG